MDISSVHLRPVPVTAQAVMTLTHGHPRLTWPVVDKVNTYFAWKRAHAWTVYDMNSLSEIVAFEYCYKISQLVE